MPKFSVVISVFNKESFIKETVMSVLNQNFRDIEIIIVNDASTDTSDDIINENYLTEISELINTFPEHCIFATAVLKEHKKGTSLNQYSFNNHVNDRFLDLDYFKSSLKNTILTSSSTVINASVLKKIGYYDEDIKSGQDTDLWIRIGLEYRVAFSTNPLVTYKYAPHSLYKSIHSIADRPSFLKFIEEEKENLDLKKYIDLNRYSLIIRAKLWGEKRLAQQHLNHLDINNLNRRQKWLLNLPTTLLKIAFKTQRGLEKIGIRLSAF